MTAYSPWANGMVEVMNRQLLKAMRSLLSERRLSIDSWPTLLPLSQLSYNRPPSSRLGVVVPITAFTALPATDRIRVIYQGDGVKNIQSITAQDLKVKNGKFIQDLQHTI